MTIVHVVILKFQRALTEEESVALVQAANAMRGSIGVIRRLQCGCDLGLNSIARSSYSLTAEFASIDDYKEYSSHPEHLAFIDKYLKPYIAKDGRTAIQFEV